MSGIIHPCGMSTDESCPIAIPGSTVSTCSREAEAMSIEHKLVFDKIKDKA